MTSSHSNPAVPTLFAAQVASLAAVGLLPMALALAACRIDGASAGKDLGLLLVLKLVAYLALAPLAETLLRSMPRKPVMLGLDLGRMLLLVPTAFAVPTLQIATLTFALFVLAATIAPLCQPVIPDVLPETGIFVHALAWSRVALALDVALSSSIAAGLLGVTWAEHSFLAAALAFVGSILALSATRFPAGAFGDGRKPILERAVIGLGICRHTPRLRGLILWILALSLALALVLLNSVVFAGLRLGDSVRHYPILMALWAGFGLTSSLVLARGGLVITRSAHRRDRPAVFAAAKARPADGPLHRMHWHPDLPADHQHLRDIPVNGPGHARRHDCPNRRPASG